MTFKLKSRSRWHLPYKRIAAFLSIFFTLFTLSQSALPVYAARPLSVFEGSSLGKLISPTVDLRLFQNDHIELSREVLLDEAFLRKTINALDLEISSPIKNIHQELIKGGPGKFIYKITLVPTNGKRVSFTLLLINQRFFSNYIKAIELDSEPYLFPQLGAVNEIEEIKRKTPYYWVSMEWIDGMSGGDPNAPLDQVVRTYFKLYEMGFVLWDAKLDQVLLPNPEIAGAVGKMVDLDFLLEVTEEARHDRLAHLMFRLVQVFNFKLQTPKLDASELERIRTFKQSIIQTLAQIAVNEGGIPKQVVTRAVYELKEIEIKRREWQAGWTWLPEKELIEDFLFSQNATNPDRTAANSLGRNVKVSGEILQLRKFLLLKKFSSEVMKMSPVGYNPLVNLVLQLRNEDKEAFEKLDVLTLGPGAIFATEELLVMTGIQNVVSVGLFRKSLFLGRLPYPEEKLSREARKRLWESNRFKFYEQSYLEYLRSVPNNSFDLVYTRGGLEIDAIPDKFGKSWLEKLHYLFDVYEELYRVLRPGGAVVNFPYGGSEEGPLSTVVQAFFRNIRFQLHHDELREQPYPFALTKKSNFIGPIYLGMPTFQFPGSDKQAKASSLGAEINISVLEDLKEPVNVFMDGREINKLSLSQKEELVKLAGSNPKKLQIVIANASSYDKPPELDFPNIIFTPKSEVEASRSVRRAEHNLHMSLGVDPAKEFTLIGNNKFRYPDEEAGFLGVALLYTQAQNPLAFSIKYGLKKINGFFSSVSQALLGLVQAHEATLTIGYSA